MPKPIPVTVPNPNNASENPQNHNVPETLITLTTPITVPMLHGKADLELTYTPDRFLITPDSFLAWLDGNIKHGENQTWEELAGSLTDIFYDTLLPKHIALALHIDGKVEHTIEMVKQQPRT